MIDKLPLLSVVIPTHNRAKYAISAIDSLLSIDDERLEVVVSDTSTNEDLFSFVEQNTVWRNDRRLKYFRPPIKLDMTGNHNAALGAAKGEFVCLIGDDDTIVHDALVAASWARSNGVDLIAPNVVANYVWPDFKSRLLGQRHASRLYIAPNIGNGSIVDSNFALVQALKNAAQGTDGLPKIYHGIVKRSVLEEIRKISGNYFHGSSPDVSGAMALALCSKNFLIIDYPLTIPGASGGSNTGRSAMNTHKGTLNQESQTKGFETKGWSIGVPKFFSVETVWAHAAIETINLIKPEMISSFNFPRLIAICQILHPEFSNEIKSALAEIEGVIGYNSKTLARKVKIESRIFSFERTLKFVKRISKPTAAGGRKFVGNLTSVAMAPPALAQHMSKLGITWNSVTNNLHLEP